MRVIAAMDQAAGRREGQAGVVLRTGCDGARGHPGRSNPALR